MSFWNTLRLRNKLIVGFSIPALVIAGLSILINVSLNRLQNASAWVAHTHTAIGYGDTLLSAMIDMETGLRGYLISGSDVFLEPYDKGETVFLSTLVTARKHVSDNPAQLRRLDQIETLQTAWITDHAEPAIALRVKVNAGAAVDERFRVLSARTVGKEKFDGFRAVMAELDALMTETRNEPANKLIQAMLMSMINQETGQRGFLLTGKEESLEPFVAGREAFADAASQLAALFAQSSDQRLAGAKELVNKAVGLSEDWVSNAAQPEIDERRAKNNFPLTILDIAEFIGRGLGKASMDELRSLVDAFTSAERDLIVVRENDAQRTVVMTRYFAIVGALLAVLSSIFLVILITRNVGNQLGTEPSTLEEIARAIAGGDLEQDLTTDRKATGVYAAMQTMQSNLRQRREQDRVLSAEMERVTQALDCTSSPVLVTDTDHTVVFHNRSAVTMFKALEPFLRKTLPNFTADKLIGLSLSNLQGGSGIADSRLASLAQPLENDLNMGGFSIRQTFSPVIDEDGNRLGVVAEWLDRTTQVAVENEVQGLVKAALQGDLSQRLGTSNKKDFFLLLSEQMNALMTVCDTVVNDAIGVFSALSRSDLTVGMQGQYLGSFAALKQHANQTIHQLTDTLSKVKTHAITLDTASGALRKLNNQMYSTAESSAHQANVVSSAAEQIRTNINNVATAGEEMSASIREIARNSAEASKIAGDAVALAESTGTTVRQLSTSSTDIGHVIKVINSIAEQTNLLALNATIEAARAGDAGKGFAVVANEVKELAKETAKATDEIQRKVSTIQTDSDSAVAAIVDIDKIIQLINEIQMTTAAAVEEQAATTNEIVRSVSEAAHGSNQIAENILLASDGAQQTLVTTNHALTSTGELAELAAGLRDLVDQFDMRADSN